MFESFLNLFGLKPKNKIISGTRDIMVNMGNDYETLSASSVSQNAVFYTCVNVISRAISQLPVILYRRIDNDSRERAVGHPLYSLMKLNPNSYMTSSHFIQLTVANILTYGISYAQIVRVGNKVVGLYPIDRNAIIEDWKGNKVTYYATLTNGDVVKFHQKDILRIVGETTGDGRTPVSPIWVLNKSLYLAIAAERFGLKFFSNNASPSGVLETEGGLNEESIELLKKSWAEKYSGDNLNSVAVLSGGLKFKPITISQEASQFLQTRQYQRSEIAAAMGVPPYMVGDNSQSYWGSGIEQVSMGFVTNTLMPHIRRIEQSLDSQLLGNESDEFYFEFLTDAFVRGTLDSRAAYYMKALGSMQSPGWISVEEVRKLENLPLDKESMDRLYKPIQNEQPNLADIIGGVKNNEL